MNILVGNNNAKTRGQLEALGINYNVVFDGGIGKIYVDEAGAIKYLRGEL